MILNESLRFVDFPIPIKTPIGIERPPLTNKRIAIAKVDTEVTGILTLQREGAAVNDIDRTIPILFIYGARSGSPDTVTITGKTYTRERFKRTEIAPAFCCDSAILFKQDRVILVLRVNHAGLATICPLA